MVASVISLVPISGVCERDVDLLILEEFIASFGFLQWFASRVANHPATAEVLLNAKRSVTQSNGESDIEIYFKDSVGAQVCLLIENKVNAALQPQQAERYRARGQTYRDRGDCIGFYTILMAPKSYFGTDADLKGFDASVTYEEIRDWFRQQPTLGERQRYKESLLTAAIKKGIGKLSVADAPVTDFWQQYWQLVQGQAPELNMKQPLARAASSWRIAFYPTGLVKGVTLVHSLPRGCIDLLFGGMGERLGELKSQFGRYLGEDMSFEKANGSSSVRLQIPPINAANDFISQRQDAMVGIAAVSRLSDWYARFGEKLLLERDKIRE